MMRGLDSETLRVDSETLRLGTNFGVDSETRCPRRAIWIDL